MRKILLKILLLVAVFISSICIVNIVFIPKRSDGILTMKCFYEQEKDTVDALFLGSSHCGMSIDTRELWNEYGISGYALWGSVQPSWNSYYYLQEALKTQSPKVVAFEVYLLTKSFEYSDEPRQLVNTGGIRFSLNKWEAIKVSAPEERWVNLWLGYPLYHTRYDALKEEDFLYFPGNRDLTKYKGTTCRWGTETFELPDVSGITEFTPLHEKSEIYLRKIIELCQEKEIPIVLYAVPEAHRDKRQPFYNSIEMIAQEYGIDFLNYNLMDDELGFTAEDIFIDGDHLNTSGARKITRAIGEFIQSHYGLEDHRGEERYSSWNENADMLEKEYLKLIKDKEDYFAEVSGTGYTCLLIQNNTDCLMETVPSDKGIAVIRNISGTSDLMLLDCTEEGRVVDLGEEFQIDMSAGITVYREGKVLVDKEGNGAAAIIYDEQNREVVDIVVMLEDKNFEFEHRRSE